MISEIDDMFPFVTIRVFAVLVDCPDSSSQTDRTSFVSINESHLEALAVVWGILLQVRNYKRRAKVQSYPARSFTCRRPCSNEFYSLDCRFRRRVGSHRLEVEKRKKRLEHDLPTFN